MSILLHLPLSGMATSDPVHPWWDREIDEGTGRLLRADVREAGHKVWKRVCLKTREVLGDPGDAADLLEQAVKAISRYLDKNSVPLHSVDPGGLLILACHRSLRRLVRRRWRIEFIGSASELAEILRAPDWRDEIDRRLFLEDLTRQLDVRNRGILRFRIAGYDWNEIGRMLGATASVVRQSFWRDVRKAHIRLLRSGAPRRNDEG